MEPAGTLEHCVIAITRRFFAQNGRAVPPVATIEAFAARFAALVASRGLPPPLAPGDRGRPGGIADDEVGAMVAAVVGEGADNLLADAARQLVKACFYPEFADCRDSFRERKGDGNCRRQELARVRGRVSGTHCVDCPYWTTLAPKEHATFLAANWHAGPADFEAHRSVFLPEDFRALRRWLHAAARVA